MEKESREWLLRKLIEENGTAFRSVWQLYLQFYTVFLTFSITALAATIQFIKPPENRWPIVLAFVFQNLLSAGTAYGVARYSQISAQRFEDLCQAMVGRSGVDDHEICQLRGLCASPSPGWLGRWGGLANLASHASMIVCWLAAPFV